MIELHLNDEEFELLKAILEDGNLCGNFHKEQYPLTWNDLCKVVLTKEKEAKK